MRMEFVVTGASTGIGFDLVTTLLQQGYQVWAGVRELESLAKLKSEFGSQLHAVKLDVTVANEIQELAKVVSANNHGQPIVLINNAGVALAGPLEGLPLAEWKSLFDVNVFGLVAVTQAMLPLIRKTKGRVINIGSISGRIASPFLGPYTGSKHAVRGITDALRREMNLMGVKVSLIEPGPIQTPIWEKSKERSDKLRTYLNAEQAQAYSIGLRALTEGVEQVIRDAVPVSEVTRTILKCIQSSNPKAYYLVGKAIRFQAFLAWLLPVRIMDKLLALGFRGKR